MSCDKRIAVVGSGITGLSAAWLLQRSGAKVTLFEKEDKCGGHTLTDTTTEYPVDLGFQVYNLTTYGNLVGFLEALGVDTEPSDMSFALSVDAGAVEWGSHNLDSIFAQRKNLLSPSFLRMIYDVIRFGRQAPEVMTPSLEHEWSSMSLGTYLELRGYSQTFRRHYVLPMCAAVWSVPEAQVMEFPVGMLVRFWLNHHLLDLTQRPLWRVVKGRSQSYVRKVLEEVKDVLTGADGTVVSVQRPASGSSGPVTLTTESGLVREFDALVLAVHSDIALAILGEGADPVEKGVLGAIPYSMNDVYLHTDDSLMPCTRKTWASWNFLGTPSVEGSHESAVCVSYWLNSLQQLGPAAPNMFVTLNPPSPPAADKTIRRLALAHPVYNFAAVQAQQQVPSLQGNRSTYFAGAWCGYGFHEDGLKAGVAVATALGAEIPWTPRTTSPKVTLTQSFFFRLFDGFARTAFLSGHLRIILPTGAEVHYGDPNNTAAPVPAGEEWRQRPPLRATLRCLHMDMFRKIVMRHDTGMGEAYMDGDFEVDDMGGFLAVVVANAINLESSRSTLGLLNWVGDRLLFLSHRTRANTIEGSRKNIEEHYDAGNAMYRLFLDDTMTYSSALHAPGRSLKDAQLAKLDEVIDRACLKESDHVLEVGCGWGSFAMRAVQRTGCRVTGLTLSKEQLAEATQRVKEAGLQDRIVLKFCDYRHCPGEGTFDKLVSIEMVEAVGHEHLTEYFQVLGRMLKPGGLAVIQAITMPDERYAAYCASSDFIREHIFPGGHLPSMGAMVEAARTAQLSAQGVNDIGPHYAITLREWREAWEARKAEALALGYSERFWKKYRFYFVYCEAAFDARYIRNLHITWVKDSAAAGSAAGAGSGAISPEALSKAVMEELPADPVTQVLLAIYFFLAGVVVRISPHLWLMPLTSALCALLFTAVRTAASLLLPGFQSLTPRKGAWWAANVLHVLYSLLVAVVGCAYLLRHPSSATSLLPRPYSTFPSIVAAASTGFFAFQLWVYVRYRLFSRSLTGLLVFTALLCLLAVSAVKHVAVPLLPVLLLGELHTCVHLMDKNAALIGTPLTSSPRPLLRLVDRLTLIPTRIIPQSLALLAVALHPASFPAARYWALSLLGLALSGYINVRRMRAAEVVPQTKLHTA